MNTGREAQIAECSIADHLMHILRESSAARRGSAAMASSGRLEDGQALILVGPAPTSPTLRALSLALGDRHGLRETASETIHGAGHDARQNAHHDAQRDIRRDIQREERSEDHLKIRYGLQLRAPDGSCLDIADVKLQPDPNRDSRAGSWDLGGVDGGAATGGENDADAVSGAGVWHGHSDQQDDESTLVERVLIATAPGASTPAAAATITSASKALGGKAFATKALTSEAFDGGGWEEALDEARLLAAALGRLTLADLLDGMFDNLINAPTFNRDRAHGRAHDSGQDRGQVQIAGDAFIDNDATRRKRMAAAKAALAAWRIDPAGSAFVLLARQDVVTPGGRFSAPSSITVRDLRLRPTRHDTRSRREDQDDARGGSADGAPYGGSAGGACNVSANVLDSLSDSAPAGLSGASLSGASTSAGRVEAIAGLAPGSTASTLGKLLERAWRKVVRDEPWTLLPAWLSDESLLSEPDAAGDSDLVRGLVLNDTVHRSAAGRRGRPFIGASQWVDTEDAKLPSSRGATAKPATAQPAFRPAQIRDKHMRAILAAAREIAAASMLCGERD